MLCCPNVNLTGFATSAGLSSKQLYLYLEVSIILLRKNRKWRSRRRAGVVPHQGSLLQQRSVPCQSHLRTLVK